MPFFGVDDILFLLASSTALLWARRADVVESGVYTTVRLISDDPEAAARCAAAAAAQHGGSPSLLLPGFDLPVEEETHVLSLQGASPAHGLADDGGRGGLCFPPAPPLTVTESMHTQLQASPLVYQVPQVPHRQYNRHKRRPHVSTLATATEEVVRDRIGRYTVAEVQALFATMERESLWEAVIHVSYGIEQAEKQLLYLNQHNVECAIRTLLNTAHPDVALVYYLRFGEDMLVADDILLALFHACRNDAPLSLELCQVLQPFKSQWTPTVYACCLTTTARFDYAQAIALYHAYLASQRSHIAASQRTLHRVLASSPLLREAGVVAAAPEALPLHYLYHVIVPLVVTHDPDAADAYVEDMLAKDGGSAPEVLLRCLGHRKGQELSWLYLQRIATDASTDAVPSTETEALRRWVVTTRAKLSSSGACEDVAGLAIHLYRLRPSAMNMNTLLKLCTEHGAGTTEEVGEGQRGRIDSAAEAMSPIVANAAPLDGTAVPTCPGLRRLASGRAAVLRELLHDVPLHSALDATVLARTITEQRASCGLAAQFLSVMLQRKCFNVVPAIAAHLARQGRWATAARSMAIYLSNQRSAMSAEEAKLCVESCVHAGQWTSALFWVERAHAKGLALAPATYDLVLGASRHCPFDAAARVMTTMHDVGAGCTERGILDFIEGAAHRGKIAHAFRVLQHHSNVEWTL
ncbi:hypothetical protein NESM_000021000 [Novymonas esmeraldas]|uniref:Uncharacterized protein n=1 Tax=Novymonas esmeraldas TaxID=1808958 RepID=A0AAW0F0Z7_9TRYP